jgi:hypothetical protein
MFRRIIERLLLLRDACEWIVHWTPLERPKRRHLGVEA